jgi:ubiquinone biosynthesis protein
METQPQLLLLQKTMLVAEGTGRALCPDVNMWTLARPMMSDWIREEMSVPVRLRETMDAVGDSLGRLAETGRLIEQGIGWLAEGRVRLHPESLTALKAPGGRRLAWLPWLIAIAASAFALTR